jgi:two-component system, OmpR family, sensor kinase
VVATASTTSEGASLTGWTDASPFDRRHLLPAWTLWALGCVIFMLALPGQETIPYHLGWAGFALAFGLGTWSRWQLVTALAWYTLTTGVVLERSWLVGNIGWNETTEIPLMFMLAMLMVWHVRRRQAALAHVTWLAERDVHASFGREQLMQLTSHELRTPLTIARGYIELLQTRDMELENQQDLCVVADELERLSRVSDRLVRMIRLQDDTTSEIVDIDQVMAQAVERWRVVADRRWMLDARAGHDVGSPERLRTGLDTLVENAIRYTSVGDTIRLVGSRQLQHVVVGVFDSGVGLTDHQIIAMNAGEQSLPPATTSDRDMDIDMDMDTDPEDLLAGTGLGLSIVRALAHAHGGTLRASHAPDGGAAMILTFPLNSPGEVGPFVPRVASGALPMQPARPT